MKRKIGVVIMFGLICISILSGCGSQINENKTDFEELDVDYVINDDGTYTQKDINYNYKIEVSGVEEEKPITFVILTNDKTISVDNVADSLKKSEVSIDIINIANGCVFQRYFWINYTPIFAIYLCFLLFCKIGF